MLLWLWCRLAAIAPIQPQAWELSYAAGTALKRQKKHKKLKSAGCFPLMKNFVKYLCIMHFDLKQIRAKHY